MKRLAFKVFIPLTYLLGLYITPLYPATFTVCSYNCGGADHHYDFYREVTMHKLLQRRYNQESEQMALLERVENTALKILFSQDPLEKSSAIEEWNHHHYQEHLNKITHDPTDKASINYKWHTTYSRTLSHYQAYPVALNDYETEGLLRSLLRDIIKGQNLNIDIDKERVSALDVTRSVIATRIFKHELDYDIFCLQEANNITVANFPSNYDTLIKENRGSVIGVVWNKERFALVEEVAYVKKRGLIVLLQDLETDATVLVASAHLHGCNPFYRITNNDTGVLDSKRGDLELEAILSIMDTIDADTKIIGMDANVTATHPRMLILKESDYTVDYRNFLEATCTNPYSILNTRIDWIAGKSSDESFKVTNIPVLSIGLNSIQTNFSDHKPIAAKITYGELDR